MADENGSGYKVGGERPRADEKLVQEAVEGFSRNSMNGFKKLSRKREMLTIPQASWLPTTSTRKCFKTLSKIPTWPPKLPLASTLKGFYA